MSTAESCMSTVSTIFSPRIWVETLLGFYVPKAALMEPEDAMIADAGERVISDSQERAFERSIFSGFNPGIAGLMLRTKRVTRHRRGKGRKAPSAEVRRTPAGMIDVDFYRTRALSLRDAARHDRTAMKFLAAGISVSAVTLAVFLTIAASRPTTVVEHIPAPAPASSLR